MSGEEPTIAGEAAELGEGRVAILRTTVSTRWPVESAVRENVQRVTAGLALMGVVLGALFADRAAGVPFILGIGLALVVPTIVLVVLAAVGGPKRSDPTPGPPVDQATETLPTWSIQTDSAVVRAIEFWCQPTPRLRPEVIAVCHPSIAEIAGTTGPSHLLEEEPIVEGDVRILGGRVLLVLAMMAGVFVLGLGIMGGARAIPGMVYVQMSMPLLVLVPMGTQLFRRIRSKAMPRFTVGTGFVRDGATGRHLTVADAVLFARPHRLTPLGEAAMLRVDLVGRAFSRRFLFRSPSCPEFLALWRRWCHPHPRPELAGLEPIGSESPRE